MVTSQPAQMTGPCAWWIPVLATRISLATPAIESVSAVSNGGIGESNCAGQFDRAGGEGRDRHRRGRASGSGPDTVTHRFRHDGCGAPTHRRTQEPAHVSYRLRVKAPPRQSGSAS